MNAHETSHDARVHTAKLREEMQALIAHLRRDVGLVDEFRKKSAGSEDPASWG